MPAWLSDFQARFSSVLRTPLDRGSGRLRAEPERYDSAALAEVADAPPIGPAARLAVYNRQYWLRLFGVLHSELPLTARLCGYWRLNGYAARFLLAHPPSRRDVHEAATGFAAFLKKALDEPDPLRAALCEAAAIDEAWRRAVYAPAETAWRAGDGGAQLAEERLRPAAGFGVVEEHWPLVGLRQQLIGAPGEAPVELPARLASPQHWAIFRAPTGVGLLALAPVQARLFALLGEHPLAEALALLEAGASPGERALLPSRVRAWLAQSVELGLWAALEGAKK